MTHKATIKTLCKFTVLAAFTVGAMCGCTTNEPGAPGDGTSQRPNILLIIGDDIGMDVTTNMYPGLIDSLVKQYGPSGHNHPDYRQIDGRPASTPTLDALAKAGMKFTQAWAQPFCSPTRTSLLTGLYAAKTGVLDYNGWLSQNHHSFVRDLKEKAATTPQCSANGT